MLDTESRPVTKPDVDVEELEDEIVVNHPEMQEIYNFNGTAAFIWSLSNGSHTLEEIIDEIHRADPTANRGDIKEDVLEFIDKLYEKNLITFKES